MIMSKQLKKSFLIKRGGGIGPVKPRQRVLFENTVPSPSRFILEDKKVLIL